MSRPLTDPSIYKDLDSLQRRVELIEKRNSGATVGGGGGGALTAGSVKDLHVANDAAIQLTKLAVDPRARANHTGTQLASTISDLLTAIGAQRLDQHAAPIANVAMGGFTFTNMGTPSAATDAATKGYVDGRRLDQMTVPTAAWSNNSQRITLVADPTGVQDAATKNYVDNGDNKADWKTSVVVASTVNVPLSGGTGFSIDTVPMGGSMDAARVLLKNQTNQAENGLYQYNYAISTYTLTRTADADSAADFYRAHVHVESGTQKDTQWWAALNGSFGVSPIVWTQYAGLPLDKQRAPVAAVAFNGQKITGLADPSAAQDAATKAYTDLRAGSTVVLDNVPIGTIAPFGGAAAPNDWLLCQGQSLLRTDYPDLFTALGTTYGSADSTHFTLPDLRGRMPIGSGTATGALGATAHSLGSVGGEETHILTVTEMPSHTHNISDPGHVHSNTNGSYLEVSASVSTFLNTTNNASYAVFHAPNTATAFTGITIVAAGGGAAHPNMPPFVTTNYIIKATAAKPTGILAAVEAAPVGTVAPYAGPTAPTDWALCDGAIVSRSTYAELFAVIGTAYGAGDGSTTFGLPDLRGRVPVGAGTAAANGATAHTVGQMAGEEKHTLSIGEMPSHQHGGGNHAHALSPPSTVLATGSASHWAFATAAAGPDITVANIEYSGNIINLEGGGASHNLMQPYTGVNYIIRLRPAAIQKYVVAADMSPIGAVTAYAAAAIPNGWLKCDGAVVSRTTYPELFTVLGTTYGAGDGSTTFGLPDLSGRTVIGTGTATGAAGATAHALAEKLGEETHVLLSGESGLRDHIHANSITGVGQRLINSAGVGNTGQPPGGSPTNNGVTNDIPLALTLTNGGVSGGAVNGSAHNNMQPYVAMTYIIKAFNGSSPTASTTGNSTKANLPFTGDGSTSIFILTHTLPLKANEPFIGQVWEADVSGNPTKQAVGDILYNDFKSVKVSFSRAPAAGTKYIVTVIG